MPGAAPGKISVRRRVNGPKRSTFATSSSCGSRWLTACKVLKNIGKKEARAINTILPPLSLPTHAVSSGSQAKSAIWRRTFSVGVNICPARGRRASSNPHSSPIAIPSAPPAKARPRLASIAAGSSPLAAPAIKRCATASGEENNVLSIQPQPLASCHSASRISGSWNACQLACGFQANRPVAGCGQKTSRA